MSTNTLSHVVNPSQEGILTNSYATPSRSDLVYQVERFDQLRAHLWRGGTVGNIWIKGPRGKYTIWLDANDPLPDLPQDSDIYFSVNPLTQIPPTNAKGKETDPKYIRSQIKYIAAINCLYAEFDADHFGNDGAMDHILSLKVQPTEIIRSSAGSFHCYWLLDETVVIDSEESLQRVSHLQSEWVAYVGGDRGAKDTTRVLRVAGFYNRKIDYTSNPPLVEFINARPGRHYSVTELESLLPPPPPPTDQKPKRVYDQLPENEVERALSYCSNVKGFDPKFSILAALYNEFGPTDGLRLAEKYIGSIWHPDNGETIAQKFASFATDRSKQAGIGTIFYYAAQHGYERSEDVRSFVPSEQYQTRAQFEQLITATRRDVVEQNFADHVPKHLHAQYKDGRTVYRTRITDKKIADAFLDLCERNGSTEIHASSRELIKLTSIASPQTAINALKRLSGWFVEPVENDKATPTDATIWRLVWTPVSTLDTPDVENITTVSNLKSPELFSLYKGADPFLSGTSKTAKKLENELKALGPNALFVIDALTECDGLTRAQIAESRPMPPSAASDGVRRLREYGLITESDAPLFVPKEVYLEAGWLDILSAHVPKMTTYKLSLEREDRHLRVQIAYCDKLLCQRRLSPVEFDRTAKRRQRLRAERIAVLEQLHEDRSEENIQRLVDDEQAAVVNVGRRMSPQGQTHTHENGLLICEAEAEYKQLRELDEPTKLEKERMIDLSVMLSKMLSKVSA